jgi:hypothetical protein
MFRFLFSIPFVCFGVYALAAVFVPGWRTGWRGTRVMGGLVTHLGFGLTFTAAGAILMFARDNKDPVVLAIAGPPLIVGVPLVLIGNWLDFRNRPGTPSPAADKRPTGQR